MNHVINELTEPEPHLGSDKTITYFAMDYSGKKSFKKFCLLLYCITVVKIRLSEFVLLIPLAMSDVTSHFTENREPTAEQFAIKFKNEDICRNYSGMIYKVKQKKHKE